MKLLTVLVSHNRLELTQQTITSFLATVTVPHYLVVVDNASTDGTQDWLQTMKHKIGTMVYNDENSYPGAATNFGWQAGLDGGFDATHLMRTDNDMEFRPGWCEEAVKAFTAFPELGQLGLMNQEQEFYPEPNRIEPITQNGYTVNTYWGNIGGTHIMPRKLWDMGIRYAAAPWTSNGKPTAQEDVKLSLAIKSQGYLIANLIPNLVWHLGDKAFMRGEHEDYYRKTFTDRGYDFDAWLDGQIKGLDE